VGGRRRALVGAAAVAVVAALVLVGLALTGNGEDGDEVRLEAIDASFEGDLVSGLDLRPLGRGLAIALPDVPPLGAALGGALGGRAADGDRPGLYGGSRDVGTCDLEQLVDFLTDPAHAAEARAWAEVLDVDVDDIGAFVDDLTPVRLRFDTRVTNHGFDGARATPLQSVLQAGTAVLVDDRGVPRVKCACGNPLLPPAGGGEPANPGGAWTGFDPDRVVAVEAGEPVDAFVLVDVDDGVLFERRTGTDGEADRPLPATGELCDEFAGSPTCTGLGADRDAPMPDLAGSTAETAARLLTTLGFVGEVTERSEPSDDVIAGNVLRTEPPAGRTVPVKSPIVLIVSSGPQEGGVATTSTARSTSTTTPGSSTSTSTSTTSTSSTSTTTTAPQQVTVPDVVGMTRSQAEVTLTDAGLVPQAESDFNPPPNVPDGTVTGQDPQAGTVVAPGSTVRIFVADTIG
jgi:hypothetical protein